MFERVHRGILDFRRSAGIPIGGGGGGLVFHLTSMDRHVQIILIWNGGN